ncbi:MAG: transcription-repair coupling factor [Acidobacteria bacterium]|nr:MAG: transcription-repair coupling factor [Acidobacteriota bacterium]
MTRSIYFPESELDIIGLRGSAGAWNFHTGKEKQVIITTSTQKAEEWKRNLVCFNPALRVMCFPVLPGTPYVPIPLHEKTILERKRAIQAMLTGDWDVVISLPQVFFETYPVKQKLLTTRIALEVGTVIDPECLVKSFIQLGYSRVDMVSAPGEFAKRGAVLDVFPPLRDYPVRLEFFDDELEEIRTFDPESQRSVQMLKEFTLTPHDVWQVSRDEIQFFAKKGAETWNHSPSRQHFLKHLQNLQETGSFQGYQHWTPFLFEETQHFLDFPGGSFRLILDNSSEIESMLSNYSGQIETQELEARQAKRIYAQSNVLFNLSDFPRLAIPEGCRLVTLNNRLEDKKKSLSLICTVNRNPTGKQLFQQVETYLQKSAHTRVLIVFHSAALKKRFIQYYDQIEATELTGFDELPDDNGVYLLEGHLTSGFEWTDRRLILLSDRELWPEHRVQSTQTMSRTWFNSEAMDMKVGDLIVHEDYGIGRFDGLGEVKAGPYTYEMVTLTYKDNAKLHVSLSQIGKIERLSSEAGTPNLDSLGGTRWIRTKEKVKKALEDMADRLIQLYAVRSQVQLDPCSEDDVLQTQFEEVFEYHPTPDQIRATMEIKSDLASGKPMDRLLVGDVGFGKTEVAMRMMFKLVNEGKQVAFLCPTTVLAFQHYMTCKERFEGFPVHVGFLSRLSSKKERDRVLMELKDGVCDMVIGTHRLLSADLVFKSLGGLVIDEEQRFGVRHKERIKEMKKDIHVLAMSATPIPRTLNMALTGIRDISIIKTPPRNRLAIATTVSQFDWAYIKNAISFELSRGGQVYFIHNKIETMPDLKETLQELMPHLEIGMAHGKMAPRELEDIMLQFIQNKMDVLVATTLVENGVDVPNANTMIINRADKFGLSQLYQLRGRIGRSDRAAYAYLLVPRRRQLTERARRRLEAIEEFSDLGSGFRLAAMDLEIRGAGNLLGASQSGHIQAVGYSLYMRMLREASRKLQGKRFYEEVNPVFNLKTGASIPKTYIEDASQRLAVYKTITGSLKKGELDNLKERIGDCYGKLPEKVESLFKENEVRIGLIPHKVLSVDREGSQLHVRFHQKADVDLNRLTSIVQSISGAELRQTGVLVLPITSRNVALETLQNFFHELES